MNSPVNLHLLIAFQQLKEIEFSLSPLEDSLDPKYSTGL